ncbi:MAG: hypothetical protein ACOCWQ_02530 [Nanoarchaeota archaeon]
MIKVIFLDMGGVFVKEAGRDQIERLARASGRTFEECKTVRKKYWSKLKVGQITDEEYWLGTDKFPGLEKGLLEDFGISNDTYGQLRQHSIHVITAIPSVRRLPENTF